ncbi:MAG: beta-lactamase family protein [Anaerolineaceae bacterium]|nr:beta-lactamase family protein [Anaerolineaceae bacterium]
MQKTLEHLDLFIEEQMAAAGTPGMVVALTDGRSLLHVAPHGLADVAAGRPVEPDTLFEIGSISKSFTAIALLQLREAGLVDLHSPVRRYLPWFHVPPAPGLEGQAGMDLITLHHLLTHTAGIVRGTDFSTEGRYEVWSLRDTVAATPPGTFFHYCNVGYKALGVILEEVLGLAYDEIIAGRIFRPLGMDASEAVITHDTRRRLAVGYESLFDDRPFHRSLPLAPAPWLETGTADGSIASTPADMAAYVRLLLNRGRGLLSEEGFGLWAGRLVPLPEDEGERGEFYGYGLQVGDEDGHTIVSHSGGMVGYYAAIAADLEGDLGAVALCNGPGEPMAVARRALRLVRWAREGRGLPPAPAGPERVEDAGAYAGIYRPYKRETRGENSNASEIESEIGDEIKIAVSAGGAGLELRLAGQRAALERRGEDCFYAPHPALSRYLLRFARREGQVVEAWCGPELFVRPGCAGEAAPEPPAAWRAYTGHYRCHNPWLGNFRVVLRRDRLILALPWGEEQPLVPLAEAVFRVGDDERLPERLRFDTVLGGRARRANLAGCDYYRTFTP